MRKKLILLLAPLALLCLVGADAPTVPTTPEGVAIFSESTDADGIKTTISFGRAQTERDGTLALRIFPRVVVTTPSGRVISDDLDTAHGFSFTLTPEQAATLNSSLKAAYDAAQPSP